MSQVVSGSTIGTDGRWSYSQHNTVKLKPDTVCHKYELIKNEIGANTQTVCHLIMR